MTSHRITEEAALTAIIGEPMDFVRAKICCELNEAMREFIACSPLVFVSTIDAQGMLDVSPKGDPAGFTHIDEEGNLLIPERLGNRLTFGFRNILRNPEIGLIYVIPNQLETLRVKGKASLHTDPDLLAQMEVGGKPALLYTRVEVKQCFFHCGKALVRSKLWDPENWAKDKRSIAARQFTAKKAAGDAQQLRTEAALKRSYTEELY
jgi:PPOX class probable FMN-dependent enzyme